MEIIYLKDSGSRHEWICRFRGKNYLAAYDYLKDSWSVQLYRNDGEHDVVSVQEANSVLRILPREKAMALARYLSRPPGYTRGSESDRRGLAVL